MNYHGGDIYRYTDEMTDFSSNINPLGVPESFKEVLLGELSSVTRYPDRMYRKLTRSIHDYIEKSEDEVAVVLGNGAVEVIYKAMQALPVESVIIAAPTFSEYRRAAVHSGLMFNELILYDRCGRLRTGALIDAISQRSLVVLCNPNNPTGTLTPRDDFLKLLEVLKSREGYLMVDETFIEFTSDYPCSSIIDERMDNLIIIRALTKYFGMPGIRLGYGVFHNKELGQKVNGLMEPWHINTFADLAGQTVLYDRLYQEETRKWIREERAYMMNELKKLTQYTFLPTESNFILVSSKKYTALEIQEILLKDKILIRLPEGFTGLGEREFRIAIKDRKSNMKLISLLEEITS
ncbi:MAG TPA: L-threonine-O-3-phosphate decarboxylase [Clostridiaceae bacterium]|nr:L-threonine-O-3-phosphate decarboxylase [Clostridiaceae bacterium]